MILKFFKDETGATAIEYGLIAALVSVAAITAYSQLGTALTSTFTSITNQVNGGGGAGAGG